MRNKITRKDKKKPYVSLKLIQHRIMLCRLPKIKNGGKKIEILTPDAFRVLSSI